MGYFTQFADAAFKSGPDGERLFYLYGPWSRPYMLSDEETERRLYRRLLWYYRISITFVILAISSFQYAAPKIFASVYINILIVIVPIVGILSLRLTFRSEVWYLSRAPSRSLGAFYDNIADKSSYLILSLRLAICLLAVGTGIVMIVRGHAILTMGISIAVFSIFAVLVGFVMLRKRVRST
ncbi:MAG TPA: hypothetical protein VKQ73_10540 [Stellaceae bacterium]|nr:hypothetical protein [Stellaceae bacterium]